MTDEQTVERVAKAMAYSGGSGDNGNREPLMWAVEKWRDEVQNRPLQNVHRRTLDDTWRTVMRKFGGDPDSLVGPSHDDLLAARGGEA